MSGSLTGDVLDVRPVPLSAEQATELRRQTATNGRQLPASQYERDLYAAEGLKPPHLPAKKPRAGAAKN